MSPVWHLFNTRQMPLDPESPDDVVEMDKPKDGKDLQFLPVFSGEKFLECVNYPVIVEMWEKAKWGRVKRVYHAAFTQDERNAIARHHAKFYRWHLVSGTPLKVLCRLSTMHLLQRAVAFFGTV